VAKLIPLFQNPHSPMMSFAKNLTESFENTFQCAIQSTGVWSSLKETSTHYS